MPNTIKEICSNAFEYCSNLSRINIPEGLEAIRSYAFAHSGLEGIVIPNSVTEIGTWAFYECRKLNNVFIGNGIQELSNFEFGVCYSLEKMFIGNGLKKITSGCFWGGAGGNAPSTLVILSEHLDSSSSFRGVDTVYVPNAEHYSESLPDYSNLFKPIAELRTALDITYNGQCPEIQIESDLEELTMVTVMDGDLSSDVGSHISDIKLNVSYKEWGAELLLPCAYSIKKAPLTIVANNISRYYGESNPSFTYTGIGFVNNETGEVLAKQPILTTTAFPDSDTGTYPIYVSGAEAKNYEIAYDRGTLTILKAPQTISWNPEFKNANVGELIELTANSTSGLDVKFKSLDMSTAIVTVNDGKYYVYPIKEGVVVIAAYQDGDKNYNAADEVYNILTISSSTGVSVIKNNTEKKVYELTGRATDMHHKGIKITRDSTGRVKKHF